MSSRKKRSFQFSALLVVFALWLYSCAQIVAPTGGEEDTEAPIMDTLASTANFQKNFTKQDIVIEFNEWIELKNVAEQVLTSPLMEKSDYDISIKKKSVVFSFDKDYKLKDDLTYIINFGESVVDYTAGNPVPNLRYVFSTGEVIDSMSVSGTVVDALTGNPVNKAVVMLHDNLADTAITTVKPLYVARSDKDGKFKLDNLKSDTFQVFVLPATDLNYKFDSLTEAIGFIDSMLILDTNQSTPLNIVLSNPIPPFRKIKDIKNSYGKISIGFNQSPDQVKITADPPRERMYKLVEDDSLFVWYNNTDTSDWNLYLEKDTNYYDTLLVKSSRLKMDVDLDLMPLEKITDEAIEVNPFDTFFIAFNFPIEAINSNKIILNQDSVDSPIPLSMQKDSSDFRNLAFNDVFTAGENYKLTFLPEALISIHNSPNDTLIYELKIKTVEDLTNFELNVTGLDSSQQYVYKLEEKKSGRIIDTKTILGQADLALKYPKLEPLDLSATIILDRNKNGVWDSGDYQSKSQPEQIKTKLFEKFLPNFDRSEDWDLSALKE